MEDHHVDRPDVDAQRCVQLTGTNRSSGLIALISPCPPPQGPGADTEDPPLPDPTLQGASPKSRDGLRRPGGMSETIRTRSHPELGRQTSQRPWYCVSRPGRVGRRQARQDHPLARPEHDPQPVTHHVTGRPTGDPHGRRNGAGWSSPVARQAHNLKAAGSNPAPATTIPKPHRWLMQSPAR